MTINNNRKKPATMKDVAELAGVSQPTVSRVLNKKNTSISISDETRVKVLAAAEQLNYHPNVLARGLRTQQTQMIAVMVADISNNFYHRIARAVQDVASEYQYDVMIANSDHLYQLEKQFLSAVSRRPVDGVIAVPIHLTNNDIDQFVRQTHTPMAVLGQQIHHPQVDVVYGDDESAIYAVTNWLINQQHYQQIGFIGVPEDLPPGPRRFHGFERAMRDLNLPILEQHIVESDFTLEGGKRAVHQLINTGHLPDVLIVLNDLMAIGVILALQDAGYVVPDDVAVVGFDNIQESTIIRPSLTTIAQDPYDIGGHLSRLLFERIEDNTLPARRIETKLQLIQRNSA